MARTLEGPSLAQALDALSGAMSPDDALSLAMVLILLRHKAEAAQSGHGSGTSAEVPGAWEVARELRSWHPQDLEVWIRGGLRRWESEAGEAMDLAVPSLEGVRGFQLGPLFDLVAAASDPAALFDMCLQAQSQMTGKGGRYYTPRQIVHLMTMVVNPRAGETVYDPACGSGGLLLQARAHVESAGGQGDSLGLYGQEQNKSAQAIAAMNLEVHGARARIAKVSSSLLDDGFTRTHFDVVMVNPPFNQSHWDDGRWGRYGHPWFYGPPPAGNANFAWVQHAVSKMSDSGRAAVLLPIGAASGTRTAERAIRAGLIHDDLLSCVVELPAGLIPHVRNAVTLWVFGRSKKPDRREQLLFIDARDAALTAGRGRRNLPDEAITHIADTFAAWWGAQGAEPYEDVPGWCRSVPTAEIAASEYDVLPSHHVGVPTPASPAQEGRERVADLTKELYEHFETSHRLERELRDLLGPV
ncbi:N-6 DNA methylase [Streptomyces sp. 110]|uniref:N-6 DNA methylase n=1 Tax=Streptomyces endocoffeicus TaxID=2898945 RepID=A0ABS1PMH0_9ACTN|nr:N-6 DNA methylase [Streptomyces endocoffeicus]MBL1113573.1 N-6 DNA methylase [Streptomyces endocoffeicus]